MEFQVVGSASALTSCRSRVRHSISNTYVLANVIADVLQLRSCDGVIESAPWTRERMRLCDGRGMVAGEDVVEGEGRSLGIDVCYTILHYTTSARASANDNVMLAVESETTTQTNLSKECLRRTEFLNPGNPSVRRPTC